jgi:hypothetical protein
MLTSVTAFEIPSTPFKLTAINPGFSAEVTRLSFPDGVPDETFRLPWRRRNQGILALLHIV